MRRAFPQKVNLVPSCVTDNDADAVAAESTQSCLGPSRVRRSAAMIGLAISMGAYSLVAPQQGDSAIAADPIAVDPANVGSATPPAPPLADITVVSPDTGREAVSPTPASLVSRANLPEYTVQSGQTLWRIAQLYKVNIATLAAANRLEPDAILFVGQVLRIPNRERAGTLFTPAQSGVSLAAPSAVVASTQSGEFKAPIEALPSLKTQQDTALIKLQEKQSRLKVSLAELKSEESVGSSTKSQFKATGLANYRVNAGETLSSIARTHGVSLAELARLNRLTDPNLLEADQMIRVPQVEKTVVTRPVAAEPQFNPESTSETAKVPVVSSLAAMQPTTTSTPQSLALVPSVPASTWDGQGSSLPETRVQPSKRYIESLTTEVNKLRQKYHTKSRSELNAKLALNAALSATSSEVNPEFRPQPLAILKAELRTLQQRRSQTISKDQVLVTESTQRVKPKLIARASLGSESYAPIVNSIVGKVVSPELPPLGKLDTYLPKGAKFTGYIWPAKGVFTSGYGWRWGRMHKGVDVAAPIGTPVVAAAPGVIITAGWNDGGYGNLVEIEHPDGSVTLYGHNDRVLVRVGQQIAQGEQIAEMGTTGYSTGPHTHFEVHLPGQGAVNPMAYLPDSNS